MPTITYQQRHRLRATPLNVLIAHTPKNAQCLKMAHLPMVTQLQVATIAPIGVAIGNAVVTFPTLAKTIHETTNQPKER